MFPMTMLILKNISGKHIFIHLEMVANIHKHHFNGLMVSNYNIGAQRLIKGD